MQACSGKATPRRGLQERVVHSIKSRSGDISSQMEDHAEDRGDVRGRFLYTTEEASESEQGDCHCNEKRQSNVQLRSDVTVKKREETILEEFCERQR